MRTPGGRWMTRKEVLDYLGLSETNFRRVMSANLLRTNGTGNGERFDAESVFAVGVLWDRLDGLLGAKKVDPSE